jgi:hypothetical protein
VFLLRVDRLDTRGAFRHRLTMLRVVRLQVGPVVLQEFREQLQLEDLVLHLDEGLPVSVGRVETVGDGRCLVGLELLADLFRGGMVLLVCRSSARLAHH